MARTILFICLAIIIFFALYELYKTRQINKPKQIILSVIGALILAYLLFYFTPVKVMINHMLIFAIALTENVPIPFNFGGRAVKLKPLEGN